MIETFTLDMKNLHRQRDISVYVPDDYYKSKKKYPVLYINDGQNAFYDEESYMGVSWGFLEYVKNTNMDIILVAIPCNFEEFKRMDEYGPWPINQELSFMETHTKGRIIGGEGIEYVRWLKDELKPFIDQHYRTLRYDTGIVGSSMGAVISAYATLEYPFVFNKCAALSTAFWFYMKEFEKVIQSHNYRLYKPKIYFDLGEFEGCGDKEVDKWYIETNAQMYRLLEGKIDDLEYHYFKGEQHNEIAWRKRVPLFMKFLYKEYIHV